MGSGDYSVVSAGVTIESEDTSAFRLKAVKILAVEILRRATRLASG